MTQDENRLQDLHRATYSISEAAEHLGISRGLAYEMARQGAIPVLRLGRRLVVPRVALERFLSSPAGMSE